MVYQERLKCTCAGCPVSKDRILAHLFQLEAWQQSGEYLACLDTECPLNCSRDATQEDGLCDSCRSEGGISQMNTVRTEKILTGEIVPYPPELTRGIR